MKNIIIRAATLSLLTATFLSPAFAQEAPAPNRAPRTPVARQVLVESKAPLTHAVQGQATIVDGERLRVNNIDLRLFGIVPPQLSASFGPQARATIDSLTSWQPVTCQIHDRDHDGRMLAVCRTANNNDLALELLRRGLAVTARGSLANSDLAVSYLAAEQAAQNQKIGLWSMAAPAPVPVAPSKTEMPKTVDAPKTDIATAAAVPDAKKDDSNALKTQIATNKAVAAITADTQMQQSEAINASDLGPENELPSTSGNFFARYQILIAGFLMLATALGITGVLTLQRRNEKRDERKAIAAALRGELMAARAVCLTRIKGITNETDDKNAVWPRIRSTLYQAYVARLGWLGAELARQIASIYGQAHDYAAYYNSNDEASATPKRQALQTLVTYIEEVLPRLAMIEHMGHLPNRAVATPAHYAPAYVPPQTVTTVTATATAAPDNARKPAATTETTSSDTTADEKPAAAQVTTPVTAPAAAYIAAQAEAAPATPLWKVVKNFARDKLAEKKAGHPVEDIQDYTSLIEEDMANLSFGENSDDGDALHPPGNVQKLQGSTSRN